MRRRGLFVTGTDTGVGKTILSAALLATMAADGERVCAHKPVVSGLEEPPGAWAPDHELLASMTGMAPEDVAPLRYGPAVSPHLAASLTSERIDPADLLSRAHATLARGARPTPGASDGAIHPAQGARPAPAASDGAVQAHAGDDTITIVEGVGGLLVPLAEDYTVRDFAAELGLGVLIAARPGLGTINHTLLTLHAAHAAGLDVRAVVLTPWPEQPSQLERSNRETIARLGAVEVEGLPTVPSPNRADLARAGANLPWRRWLEATSAA